MATGPKNSSLNAGLSGFTSVRMVVSINEPSRLRRLPPRTTLAPLATATSTCLRSWTRADSVESGPCVVFSSIGSPGLRASSADLNFARNLSAISSTTIKRFEAQQVCPALYIRPHTAHGIVFSRSASSRTINASDPPSSMEDTLRFVPALAEILLPAATLPVRATPLIRGSSITLSDWSCEIRRFVYNPSGAPASVNSFSNSIAHWGTQPACFTITVLPAIIWGPATLANW